MIQAPPESLRRVAGAVESRIEALLSGEVERWKATHPDLAEPLILLRNNVLSGGKRLRPAFCHWGFVAAGGDPSDPSIVDAGAALELLHSFAVLHDDVMDASRLRHGEETVNYAHQTRHEAARWSGEARRFGDGVAILVGDLAFVYADQLLVGISSEATEIYNELRLEVNLGQYLDLVGTARRDSDLETTRRISLYKSGKYTVERPLHLGAALAGRLSGSDGLGEALSAYGLAVGEAFQLRDDLLGAFGDPSITGKPVGEDLREGKPTPLFALAVSRATPADVGSLDRLYGKADLAAPDIEELRELLNRTGARAAVEERIGALVSDGVAALREARLDGDAATELEALARFVAERDH
ncbi:MAG TPA: polyprenyl synthetase family protein [Acidimicrobiales bacterium]|nr:polyprenyl synthetase family protein [Acidimicrobiales bacterium]